MPIITLIAAILFEVSGTISLKLSEGFTRTVATIFAIVFYVLSFWMLSLSLKKWDVGVAYAIWSAVGTALVATIGILWFKEPMSVLKIGSITLIVLGVVGLNLSGA